MKGCVLPLRNVSLLWNDPYPTSAIYRDIRYSDVLMIVVNRSESGLTNLDINTKVPINRSFMMNNRNFQLGAAICHFEVSSNSSHYTSSVFYTDVMTM